MVPVDDGMGEKQRVTLPPTKLGKAVKALAKLANYFAQQDKFSDKVRLQFYAYALFLAEIETLVREETARWTANVSETSVNGHAPGKE